MRIKMLTVVCSFLLITIFASAFFLKRNTEVLFDAVDALLQDVDKPESKIEILFGSAKQGNVPKLQKLLSQGVSINSTNKDGETALVIACASGKIDMVKYLLKQGVDITIKSRSGKTALFYAVVGQDNSGTIVSLLLEAGADPNVTDYYGATPLYSAADFGSFENIKALLKGGAKLDTKNEGGHSPLHLRVSWGDLKTSELLIDHGADINSRTKDGTTPLMEAAIGGHLEIVKLLLKRGADPDARNNEGKTALNQTEEVNRNGVESVASKYRVQIIEILSPITKP